MRGSKRARLIACAALFGAMANGCARPERAAVDSNRRDGQQDAAALGAASAAEALRAKAEVQRQSAVDPIEIEASWLVPMASDGRGQRSASEVLAEIGAQPLFSEGVVAERDVSDDARAEALRLYTQGRTLAASGEFSRALSLFERASVLDPMSREIWRELGDAQIAQGLRSSGVASLRRAAECGADDVRTWVLIATEAGRRGDAESATRWLARARELIDEEADGLAASWVDVTLGELLIERGELKAGAELIGPRLVVEGSGGEGSSFRAEYATLARRKPELWTLVGDVAARLDRWEDAAEAYGRAGAIDGSMSGELRRRQAVCLMRLGRVAEASLMVLEMVSGAAGAGAAELPLLRALGERERLLHDAIAEAARAEAVSSRQRRLVFAMLATGGEATWKERVESLPSDMRLSEEIVLAMFAPNDDVEERIGLSRALVAKHPEDVEVVADVLVGGGVMSSAEAGRVAMSSEEELLSLALRARMEIGLRELALMRASAPSAWHAVAAIHAATRAGRWDEADVIVEGLESEPAMVRVVGLGRAGRALEAIGLALDDEGAAIETASDALMVAEIGADIGLWQAVKAALRRGVEIDGEDERLAVAAADAALRTQGSDIGARLMEMARVHGRGSERVLLREQLGVVEQARFGLEAERLMRRIVELEPTIDDDAYLGLLGLWASVGEEQRASMLDDAERWLAGRSESRVEATMIALSRVLSLRGFGREGLALLDDVRLAETPRLVRAREFGLRGLGLEEEALSSARSRLSAMPLSMEEALELIALGLDREEGEADVSAGLEALRAVPRWVQVRSGVRESVLMIAGRVSGLVLRATDGEARLRHARHFAGLMDFVVGRTVAATPSAMHHFRLASLAMMPEATIEALFDAADACTREHGQVSDQAFAETYAGLVQSERSQEAVLFGVHVATQVDELFESRWVQVVPAVASLGTMATVERVLGRLEEQGLLERAGRAVLGEQDGDPAGPRDAKAEVLYVLGTLASSRGRDDAAVALFERALEFQADHPWVCNDYGYLLADANRDLDRAESLIRSAYEQLGDNANVLDSYGWLKFRQGRFADDGNEPGALTLLRRAAAEPRGLGNATIQDHLGDVSWMMGLDDAAREAWIRAEVLFLGRIREYRTSEQRRMPEYARLEVTLRRVRDKLRAMDAGEMPQVGPTLGERVEGGQ